MNQLGYFGKTRHRGDFVRFNLPQSFTKVWDDWLQQIILDGEQYHQGEWKSLYDNAPVQRFVLSSGIAGSQMWIGILLPSQDKVGRRFPFCLAMSLAEQNLPLVTTSRMSPWFADAQNLLNRMQASDYDFDQLQAELGQLAEKYTQDDVPPSSAMSTMPNLHSDSVSVAIDSADPINNNVALQALLDGLLTQTLGEYSLWMCQDGSNQSLLHGGLPVSQSALAMFRGDTKTCTPTHIDLASLGVAALATTSLAQQHNDETHDSLADSIDGQLSDDTQEIQSATTDNSLKPSSDNLQNDTQQAIQISDPIDSDDELNATSEYQSLDTSTLKQTPSADDWAALDEFEVTIDEAVKVAVPEVEPLELDEDETADTEIAPWET